MWKSRALHGRPKHSLDAFRVEVEFEAENRKKHPLRIAPAARGPWLYAIPRRLRWERQQRGVEECLLDVTLKTAGCVSRLRGTPGVGMGRPLAESRSLNPRAQCNQERKICQGGNALGSTKSCCRVLKLSIRSGVVPPGHKPEFPTRARIVSPLHFFTVTHSAARAKNSRD
jgi:hypothetical protein